MTAQRSIPALVVQSLPDCCVVCQADETVVFHPVRDGRAYPTSAPIRCPHCTGTADLLALLEVAR